MDKASGESGFRSNRSSVLSTLAVACLDTEKLGERGHINMETKKSLNGRRKHRSESGGPGSQV